MVTILGAFIVGLLWMYFVNKVCYFDEMFGAFCGV